MESRPVLDYIWTGTALRYLIDASEEYGVNLEDAGVILNIRALASDIKRYGFKVTSATAALHSLLDLADLLEGELDPESDEVIGLSSDQAESIQRLAGDLRGTLQAEAAITYAFVVRPKRYDTTRLTEDIGSLMPDGCFECLDSMTKFDLEEAGRCIAFERSTAAAFHLMRAVESELRRYYVDWVRSTRISEPNVGANGDRHEEAIEASTVGGSRRTHSRPCELPESNATP